MNLPTKLTVLRLILSLVIIVLLCFPFYLVGLQFPTFAIGAVAFESQYIVAGIIFIIASLTDWLDGYLARKNNQITDTGKMLDAIADKVLVNSVLIILAAHGYIHEIVPVIIVLRDIVVNAIKMEAAGKGKVVAAIGSGKLKTATTMVAIIFLFLYQVEIFELPIFGYIGAVMMYLALGFTILSGIEYFWKNRKVILESI